MIVLGFTLNSIVIASDINTNYYDYNNSNGIFTSNYATLDEVSFGNNNYRTTFDTNTLIYDNNQTKPIYELNNTVDKTTYLTYQSYYEFNDKSFNSTTGIYNGTFTFTNWSSLELPFISEGLDYGDVSISDYYSRDCLKISDTSNVGQVSVFLQFNETYGSIEFWLSLNIASKDFYITLADLDNLTAFYYGIKDDKLVCSDFGSLIELDDFISSNFYHLRVDFTTNSNGYYGLSADSYRILIDGKNYGLYDFDNDVSEIGMANFSSSILDESYSTYIDAIGSTWNEYLTFDDNSYVSKGYNFDNETIDSEPNDIDIYGSALVQYDDDLESQICELGTDYSYLYQSGVGASYGWYSTYFLVQDATQSNAFNFHIRKDATYFFGAIVKLDELYYSTSGYHTYSTGYTILDNTWYKVNMTFDTTVGNYDGNSQYHYTIYLNDVNVIDNVNMETGASGSTNLWTLENKGGYITRLDDLFFSFYSLDVSNSSITHYNEYEYTLNENILANYNEPYFYPASKRQEIIIDFYDFDEITKTTTIALETQFFNNMYYDDIYVGGIRFYGLESDFLTNITTHIYTNDSFLENLKTFEVDYEIFSGFDSYEFKIIGINIVIYVNDVLYNNKTQILGFLVDYPEYVMCIRQSYYYASYTYNPNENYMKNDLFGFRAFYYNDTSQYFNDFKYFGNFNSEIYINQFVIPNPDIEAPTGYYWQYITSTLEFSTNTTIYTEHFNFTYPLLQTHTEIVNYYYYLYHAPENLITGSWGLFDFLRVGINWLLKVVLDFVINIFVVGWQFFMYLLTLAFNTLIMYLIVSNLLLLLWNVILYWIVYFGMLFCEGLYYLIFVFLPILLTWIMNTLVPALINILSNVFGAIIGTIIWMLAGGTLSGLDLEAIITACSGIISMIFEFFYNIIYYILINLVDIMYFSVLYMEVLYMIYFKYYYIKPKGYVSRGKELEFSYQAFTLPFTLLRKTTKGTYDFIPFI